MPDFPPIHPGEILREDFLKPMGVSEYRLAKAMNVPPRRINEIVHGTRAITAETHPLSAVSLLPLPALPGEGWGGGSATDANLSYFR